MVLFGYSLAIEHGEIVDFLQNHDVTYNNYFCSYNRDMIFIEVETKKLRETRGTCLGGYKHMKKTEDDCKKGRFSNDQLEAYVAKLCSDVMEWLTPIKDFVKIYKKCGISRYYPGLPVDNGVKEFKLDNIVWEDLLKLESNQIYIISE